MQLTECCSLVTMVHDLFEALLTLHRVNLKAFVQHGEFVVEVTRINTQLC